MIDITRVITKEDELLSQNDYEGAKKHLEFWWKEAQFDNDKRGMLLLCNEFMGLYRKLGVRDEAIYYADSALKLVDELGLKDNVTGATAYLNAGTVYKAFERFDESIVFFEQAKSVYEEELEKNDERMAGLYNNMALTLIDLKRFAQAKMYFNNALVILRNIDGSEANQAITYLNLADCAAYELTEADAEPLIQEYCDKAQELLDAIPVDKRGGYYAFVCEKCASVFGYYGYFSVKQELERRAKEIYERSNEHEGS